MLWTVGFLGITYVPLQCVVLWKCRGAARVAAALPLLFMVPMIIAGLQPSAYHSGSLYGMFFICPYLPAMIYLVAVSSAGPRAPKVCPIVLQDTSQPSDDTSPPLREMYNDLLEKLPPNQTRLSLRQLSHTF
jgi:hypothetical protein